MDNVKKTLIGIIGIALVIGAMLLLSRLPAYVIALTDAVFFAPGFLRLNKIALIKKGKYPKAEAKILNGRYPVYDDTGFTLVSDTVKIEYTVAGNIYTCEKALNDDIVSQKGTVTVYYNPKNPQKAYMGSYLHNVWVPFAVGGFGAAVITGLYWFAVRL